MANIYNIQKSPKRGSTCEVECVICSKRIKMILSRAQSLKEGTTCSKECLLKFRKTIGANRVLEGHRKNDFNRKTGCGITTDGYVWIYKKGEHNNQIKLHRYLMEIKLGRKLKSFEVVHHKDENKLNNDIDNLQLTTISEHNRIHGRFRVEHRNDCYSKDELNDIFALSIKDFIKKYPQRTYAATVKKRYELNKTPHISEE